MSAFELRCLGCGMTWPCESPFAAAQIYVSHVCSTKDAA